MLTISQSQALQRWDLLPDEIRDAMFSEANWEFIERTCNEEHIPEEKHEEVLRTFGYVLMGFLHPEDVAADLKDRLNLDVKTANSIEEALNKRVFNLLRSTIDKIYQPPTKFDVAPKMIQDIGGPVISPMAGAPLAKPLNVPPPAAMPTPKPINFDKGWSTTTVAPAPASKPMPASPIAQTPPKPMPAPSSLTPFTPPKGPSSPAMGEFERMAMTQKPQSIPANVPPKPAEPAPVMLHEVSAPASIQKTSDFRLSRPEDSARVNVDAMAKVKPPVAPAALELGKSAQKSADPTNSNVGHYTQFKPTPLAAAPKADMGDRHVTEMTTPQPPAPPKPPAPPVPPTPPPPIRKDFLEGK